MAVLLTGMPGKVFHEGTLFGTRMHLDKCKRKYLIACSMSNIEMDGDMS